MASAGASESKLEMKRNGDPLANGDESESKNETGESNDEKRGAMRTHDCRRNRDDDGGDRDGNGGREDAGDAKKTCGGDANGDEYTVAVPGHEPDLVWASRHGRSTYRICVCCAGAIPGVSVTIDCDHTLCAPCANLNAYCPACVATPIPAPAQRVTIVMLAMAAGADYRERALKAFEALRNTSDQLWISVAGRGDITLGRELENRNVTFSMASEATWSQRLDLYANRILYMSTPADSSLLLPPSSPSTSTPSPLVTAPLRGPSVPRWANRAFPTLSLDQPLSPHQTAQIVAWRDSEQAATTNIAMSRTITVYARQCWVLENPASAATNGIEQRVLAVRCAKGWRAVLWGGDEKSKGSRSGVSGNGAATNKCVDSVSAIACVASPVADAYGDDDEAAGTLIMLPGSRDYRPSRSFGHYRHVRQTRESPMCATVMLYPWLGGLLMRASSVCMADAVEIDATTRPALPRT